MPLKSITFTDGSRSVNFDLNGVDDVSGIGDVFSRFMDPRSQDFGAVVQSWGNNLCRNDKVCGDDGYRKECCGKIHEGRVALGCLSGGELFPESVGDGFRGLESSINGAEACVDGNRLGEKEQVSEKTLRNRLARQARKERKKKRQFEGFDWRSGGTRDLPLRQSLEEKWKAENALAALKARRQFEVLEASDIEQEKKKYRTKVSADTEKNMVSIETTHAKLRRTGNLPEERGGGFVETVVSGDLTISPDSSVSAAEFRACQKALLDSEKEVQEYKRKIKIAIEKYGFPLEQVDYLDKEIWTDTQTNEAILDELYPNGYGKDTSMFDDGRFRAIGV